MNKKNIIILVVAILIFIGALAIFIYTKNNASSTNDNAQNNDMTVSNSKDTPYFYDSNNKKYTLEEFTNKPTVILYWKSDNSSSYDMISLFEKYYIDYKDKVNFLAININEADIDFDLIDNVLAAGFTIPIYFDTDLTFSKELNNKKFPYLTFIENGEIAKDFEQTVTDEAFKANLDIMIKDY